MMKSVLRARSYTASYYTDNIKSSLHAKASHRRGRSFGSISSRLRMGGDKSKDSGIDSSSSSKSIDTSTTKTANGSTEFTPLALLQVTTNDDTSSETASEDEASAEVQPKSMPTTNNNKTTDDNADEDLNIHVLSFNPSDDTYDVVMSLPLSESMKETELVNKQEETFQPTLASPDEELKQALSLQISIDVEDVKVEEEPEPEPDHTILYHKPLSRIELGDINLTDDNDSLSHGSFEVARETLQENFVAAEVSRMQTKIEEVVEDTLTGMSDIVLSCGLCLDEEEVLEEDDHTADTLCSSVESSYVESTLYQSTLCEAEKEDGNESAVSSTTMSFLVDYTPKEGVVLRQQEEVESTPQSNDDDALSICTEQGGDVVSMRSSARHAGMETTCSKREEELQMLKADVLRHHDLGSILSEYSV